MCLEGPQQLRCLSENIFICSSYNRYLWTIYTIWLIAYTIVCKCMSRTNINDYCNAKRGLKCSVLSSGLWIAICFLGLDDVEVTSGKRFLKNPIFAGSLFKWKTEIFHRNVCLNSDWHIYHVETMCSPVINKLSSSGFTVNNFWNIKLLSEKH